MNNAQPLKWLLYLVGSPSRALSPALRSALCSAPLSSARVDAFGANCAKTPIYPLGAASRTTFGLKPGRLSVIVEPHDVHGGRQQQIQFKYLAKRTAAAETAEEANYSDKLEFGTDSLMADYHITAGGRRRSANPSPLLAFPGTIARIWNEREGSVSLVSIMLLAVVAAAAAVVCSSPPQLKPLSLQADEPSSRPGRLRYIASLASGNGTVAWLGAVLLTFGSLLALSS